MRPRFRGLRIENRGWARAPVVVVHDTERNVLVRVYERLGRWRYYTDDKPVRETGLRTAARQFLVARSEGQRRPTQEERVRQALFPPSSRRVTAEQQPVQKGGPAVLTHPGP